MKVLFATAEYAPVAVVGGLAAASAGLVDELRRQKVDVTLVIPDYGNLPLAGEETFALDVPAWAGPAHARRGVLDGVGDVVLVHVAGIDRPHPYLMASGEGWPDNDKRFFGFSAAVADVFRKVGADVLHLNDWHTAATLAFLPHRPPTVFTIHTLGYQGATNTGWLDAFPHNREQFEFFGAVNPMAAAFRMADAIVAVSPHYADEIRRPHSGSALDGMLRDRGDAVHGILNGIDTGVWDPARDMRIVSTYSSRSLAGKDACRSALRTEMKLPAATGPLIAMVTRLTEQKGVDIALECAPYLASMDAQLVVLGAGDAPLAQALDRAAVEQPERIAFRNGYDESLAHRITAGADLFLMPSRFEPCGLAQMQAMRYGTLPVVTNVGGLHDTVIDLDIHPDTGTGFVAHTVQPVSVLDALHRATKAWGNKSRRRNAQRRGMQFDWSWRVPARQYVALYEKFTTRG